MTPQATASDFVVQIRERYRDAVADRWPVAVAPGPDELLSSWLHRLAVANGVAPRSFACVLDLGEGMWSARLDKRLPGNIVALLHQHTGLSREVIAAMTMTDWSLTPFLLPLRHDGPRFRATWMQFCPQCLADDEAPYFRRRWRLATRISCFKHGCGLRDRCRHCRSGIAVFDQSELIPQYFCARCGFDLRKAPKVAVKASARRLERCINDICCLEGTKGSLTKTTLVRRLLRAPAVAGAYSTKTLTNLSTSARVRCFEMLAELPDEWLALDHNAAAAYWRRAILAAGGHDRLLSSLVNLLEGRGRPAKSRRYDADLAALLGAYKPGPDLAQVQPEPRL